MMREWGPIGLLALGGCIVGGALVVGIGTGCERPVGPRPLVTNGASQPASPRRSNADTVEEEDFMTPEDFGSAPSTSVQYGSETITVTLEDGRLMREALVAFLENHVIDGDEYRSQLLATTRGRLVLINSGNILRISRWLLTNENGALVLMNRDGAIQPFGAFVAELKRVPPPETWAVSRFYFMHIRPLRR